MDVRYCPNCGVIFNLEIRYFLLNYGTIECPCCKLDIKTDDYVKVDI